MPSEGKKNVSTICISSERHYLHISFESDDHASLSQMNSFGEYIRSLRRARQLLLRQVAADLDIDASLLSRFESNLKKPTREQVVKLASILKANERDMLIHYLSERVVYELKDEGLAIEAVRVAEKKIRYIQRQAGKS